MKLQLGKMTSKELAQWFGISYKTYTHKIPNYLEILSDYCDFEKVYGGVIVKEIHTEEYDRTYKPKIEKMFLEEIEYCIQEQDGLSSIAGMSRKFCEEEKFKSTKTAERVLAKVGTKLFGITKEENSYGTIGCRNYIWAIKVDDWNSYRLMTEEEWKLFLAVIESFYSTNAEKVAKAELLEKEFEEDENMTKQEYFLKKKSLGLDLFSQCILLFKEQTGHIVVRCSQHEIGIPFEAKEKTQAAVDAIKECKSEDFEF